MIFHSWDCKNATFGDEKRGPGELSNFGGNAQHLTHFYAAPRAFFFPHFPYLAAY